MDFTRALKCKNLLFAALGDLIRHKGRSAGVTLCLVAFLCPLFTALAISEGLRFQAEISVKEGADFFISGDRYGANAPIPLDYYADLSGFSGVSRLMARVVARTYFAGRLVALVGVEPGILHFLRPLVQGEIPQAPGEVVLGQGIARAFDIHAGMPFSLGANPRKIFKVSGILSPSCLWSSDLLVMDYRDANEFFRVQGSSTQLLIYTSPGSSPLDGKSLMGLRTAGATQTPYLRIMDRARALEILRTAFAHRGGIFILVYVIGAALAVQTCLITSGLGLRLTRREIGILKAIGWSTPEMLVKIGFEWLALSLTSVSVSILLSMALTKGLRGILIAQFFIAEVGLIPQVEIPSRFLLSHGLLGLATALSVTLSGGLLSAWRRAQRSPAELVR